MQAADSLCFSAYKLSSVNTEATVLTGVSNEFYLWANNSKCRLNNIEYYGRGCLIQECKARKGHNES